MRRDARLARRFPGTPCTVHYLFGSAQASSEQQLAALLPSLDPLDTTKAQLRSLTRGSHSGGREMASESGLAGKLGIKGSKIPRARARTLRLRQPPPPPCDDARVEPSLPWISPLHGARSC